jgi:DNA polymerase elongation subunit (family B)
MNIIRVCDPKLIVLMGTTPMSAFGIAKSGITVLHEKGEIMEWEGYKTRVIVHPSFVNRNIATWEPKFEQALANISEMMGGKSIKVSTASGPKKLGKGIFRYKIPDKFYTEDYRLIDVQFLNKSQQILYIFRDKNNNKIFHKENDDYVCYQAPKGVPTKKIVPYNDLEQVMIKYKDRYNLDPNITYEGDIKLTVKHAMDYYHYNKGDAKKVFANILFFDIEVDTGELRSFPKPTEARFPINMITTIFNKHSICYVVDNKTEDITDKKVDELKIFNNEKSMMLQFIKDFKNTDPDFIAGWNCIDENGLIFLDDRIKPIKKLTKNLKLKDGDIIKRHEYTGMKIPYEIKLKNGICIYSSEDHIFPYYKKEKNKYYTSKKLIDNKYENKLRTIINENESDDIYLKIDLMKNSNTDYLWGDYIKENLDKLLSFDFIDIKIISKKLREKVKKTGFHKEKLKRNEYWQGKEFYKHSFWSYKNLNHIITKQDIIEQLNEHTTQVFKIGENYNLYIDMNEIIDNKYLKLLGFMYTDGFWSNYDKGFCFDNKDYDTIYNYNLIMNEFRRFPFKDISHKWNKRDLLYTLGIGLTNKFTLLMCMVYNTYLKKNLDVEILSRLSQKQFCSFFSGLIDGDGSLISTEISICCFENEGEDSKLLQTLLTWNGVFSYHRPNNVMIPRITFNKFFFKDLDPFHSKRKFITEVEKLRDPKNSCSNVIDKFYYDDFVLVKIDEINELYQTVNMYDIETGLHYFLYNGVETHNCISFDLEYIFTRLPQIGIQQSSVTNFGEFYVDGSKFVCNIPGTIAIDQDFLYKTFTFTKMENYKLGFIAQHELGVTKIQLPLPFNEMYWKMLNTTIEYNIRDTELLDRLEEKLAHINLMNELRIICNTSFDSVSSFGQTDSLMVSFLRNQGLSSKNSDPHIKKENYPGAYVHEPIPGAYDWITDFDFASLYPSIMITYNIGVNSFVMKTEDPHMGYDITYQPDELPEKIKVIIDPLYKKEAMTITSDQLLKKIKDSNLVHTINGCFFQPHNKELSVFGQVVDMLMTSRKKYKAKMFNAIEAKDKDEEFFYYTRQLVYKVLANTLYGVIANKAFRFFDVSLASAVTLSGQEAIKTSIIEGDAYMRHLNKGRPYEAPKPLTKKEMYGGKMPDRGNEYIVTGDTDSIFCCFQDFEDTSVKAIHSHCNKIEEFLNEEKMNEVVSRHNGNLEYNRLKLKNELVISRGLFLAKKRYAIRVVNNEGKEVDKINYMGLEIKRSDYPRKSKEFLSELSEMILKSEKVSYKRLMDYVNRKEQEFIGLIKDGDKGISRPVSYGKKLKDYKTIPQGVRAMEAWNEIMYDAHKTGAKSYMYWVSGIDIDAAPVEVREKYHKFIKDGNKLEVIAIPDEEERLPSFFIPDIKAALDFSFKNRYELLLKPLAMVKQKVVLTF